MREWKELSRKEVFSKFGKKIDSVMFEMPDGREEEYIIKNEVPTICVLALTKDNQVVITKQYRPGPKEIIYELPGGSFENKEKPHEAAKRELLEETGYKGNLQLVVVANDCGYSTRKRNCFVAIECEKITEQKLDKNEWIDVELVSLDKFREILKSG